MTDKRFRLSPTMKRFMKSDAEVRAIVGPVGSGKSSGCAVEGLRRARMQTKGRDTLRRSRWVVVRNTYSQLRDTTRKTFEQWLPDQCGRWHEQEFKFHMQVDDIDSEFLFRALDRPEDVRKLLSLEVTGGWINEAREVPKEVFDVLQTRISRYPAMIDGGPSWFGIWMDTNPWETSHWGYKLFSKAKPEGYELFEQPGGRDENAENLENLKGGREYYTRLVAGKDLEWVESYVDGKYPDSTVGSIFGRAIGKLERLGGIVPFEFKPKGINVTFDLGISDAMALWFWRLGDNGWPEVVDYYENHGEALSHYFEVLDESGYQLERLWLPHDARSRSLQTGISTLQQFITRYGAGRVALVPELSLADGIEAARWLLEQPVRFHAENCAEGLERLRSYRYEWDEESQVFTRRPLHDWASNGSDSWRYVACAVKRTQLMAPKPEEPAKPVTHPGFQLGDVWDMDDSPKPRERI